MNAPYSTKTYFDGKAFENMGIVVERIHDDLPEARTVLTQASRGSRFESSSLGEREIRLECRAFEDTWQGFEKLKERLYQILFTGDERMLYLRNHPGEYYMAHYESFVEGDRVGGMGIGAFELTFVASDPARYGQSRVYVYKGNSQQHFDLGGTADATDMRITIKNPRTASTSMSNEKNVLRLVINGQDFVLPKESMDTTLTIDVNERKVTGSARGPLGATMASHWPSLAPGRWNVQLAVGSCGTMTFEWKQRYL